MNNKIFLYLLLVITGATSCKKDDVKLKETVIYETSFNGDDGKWERGNIEGTFAGYQDGAYVLKGTANLSRAVTLSGIFSDNSGSMAVETTLHPEFVGNSQYGNGGLVWNDLGNNEAHSNRPFYVFEVAYSGYWLISKFDPQQYRFVTIEDWTLSNAYHQDNFNTIRITLTGGLLHFFINGTEVHSMAATSNTLDNVGLFVDASSSMKVNHFKAAILE